MPGWKKVFDELNVMMDSDVGCSPSLTGDKQVMKKDDGGDNGLRESQERDCAGAGADRKIK